MTLYCVSRGSKARLNVLLALIADVLLAAGNASLLRHT